MSTALSINTTVRLIVALCLVLMVTIPSCKLERMEGGDYIDPADKSILAFTVRKPDSTPFSSSEVKSVIGGDTITISVPVKTSLDNLIPDITIRAKSISPASAEPQNFTSPVNYTVRAEDGSTKTYTVVVKSAALRSMVFAGSNNKYFYAVDAVNGSLIWKFNANKNFCYSNPILYNDIVYAAADNTMYAFDAASGAVKWSYNAGDKIKTAAAYDNGIVYFGSYDHHFVGLDAKTGSIKLNVTEPDEINTTATVVNGNAYFSSVNGNVYVVDVHLGTSKKIFKTGGAVFGSSPTVVNSTLYIGSDDSNIYAINAANGQLKWKFDTEGISAGYTHPAVANNVAYFGTAQSLTGDDAVLGSLYAVDANTGAMLWKKLDHKGFYSSPTITGNTLFTTCFDGNIYALNAKTGETQWKSLIFPNSNTMPTVAEGIVYVGGGTGNLYAMDAATGTVKWKFPMPENTFTSAPCVIGNSGTIYSR
ncbi:outer membrane protein assembly factor BamB family protein [Mucilaginibacter agri]|uniref:PQQ-binding-like beta-propeller repeat protein n=1 Tax=Mucilaginibacter agri TaxID=2695265 RepID=A0A966DTW3_9SPHI|nr:PQQ-binding-like beta-propeller repeat protein [Mucilaginibacter agri]NCD71080.1 PQQ-binding-like beta-propeller repeat protein [Mucilaginibacter agri]